MRLGYLYSRYPVISQTFCDAEMLALERLGFALVIGSIYAPLTSLRHEHISRLRSSVHYAPPQQILKIWEKNAKTGQTTSKWPSELVEWHERKYEGCGTDRAVLRTIYYATDHHGWPTCGIQRLRASHRCVCRACAPGIRFCLRYHRRWPTARHASDEDRHIESVVASLFERLFVATGSSRKAASRRHFRARLRNRCSGGQ